MIIVMTNRKLVDVPVTEPKLIEVEKMGVVLADRHADEDVLYSGVLNLNHKKIKFYPKKSVADLYNSISDEEKIKPWVFFVHGFHQDPDENIKKAVQLSRRHGVNVIAFAWPSRPLDEDISMDDVKSTAKEDIIKGALGAATLLKIGVNWVYKSLRDSWVNYEPAIENAENSKIDLLAAINQINNLLPSSKPPVLLVHSMGNYLLKNVMSEINELPMAFSNIILHQADVNCPGYEWINNLNESLETSAKLYVTANRYDTTLAGSQIRRKILGKELTGRLGQTRTEYVSGDITYLDFTDGEDVSDDHEFFKRGKDDTNIHVFNCLGRIFRAEPDLLPETASQSNEGFSKMPASVNLYRIQKVIDPADIEYDPDSDHPIPSLNLFDASILDIT